MGVSSCLRVTALLISALRSSLYQVPSTAQRAASKSACPLPFTSFPFHPITAILSLFAFCWCSYTNLQHSTNIQVQHTHIHAYMPEYVYASQQTTDSGTGQRPRKVCQHDDVDDEFCWLGIFTVIYELI